MSLGERIRARRLLLNYSQEELAKKVGVDQAAISYYEKDFKTPTLMVAKRICDALEVTVDWLLTGK